MTPVLLDTVGILALWNQSDQWHSQASRVYAELTRDNVPLVTTTFVLLECGNAAARRRFRPRVNALRVLFAKQGRLIAPTDDDGELAWNAFDRGEASQAGIVDHVSFAVMRRLNLTRVFTHDKHFQSAGFITLF